MENLPAIFATGLFIIVFIMVVLVGTLIALGKRDRRRVRDDIISRLVRFVQVPEYLANLYYRDCSLDIVLKYNPYATESKVCIAKSVFINRIDEELNEGFKRTLSNFFWPDKTTTKGDK